MKIVPRKIALVAAPLLVGALAAPVFGAGDREKEKAGAPAMSSTEGKQAKEKKNPQAATHPGQVKDAREQVRDAVKVVGQMRKDAELKKQMERAHGILIIPDYARAAFIVGGRGGEGVMLSRQDGHWSNPVFYNIGGISVGAQAGGEAGSVAFLLMSEKAVNAFKGDHTFSLNAQAGLTIVNWSATAQASVGKGGDVIAWSDLEGLFAGATVSLTDITWDDDESKAYYGSADANPQAILSGQVKPPEERPAAEELKRTLALR